MFQWRIGLLSLRASKKRMIRLLNLEPPVLAHSQLLLQIG
jgi:hypothetical protein